MNLARMQTALRGAKKKMLVVPKSMPAPNGGWVSAQNLAAMAPGTCLKSINAFPTTTGVRVRGGNIKHATLNTDNPPEPVESLMAYVGAITRKMLASCDGDIFDITTVADPDVIPTPILSGQTSDYYAWVNYAVTGGNYLYAVNGTDPALLYDGTYIAPVGATNVYTLEYVTETGAFTQGLTITGAISGATANIVRVIDNGTSGVLLIDNLVGGPFNASEIITDTSTGSATTDGAEVVLAPAVTGVSTALWSHVNVYKNRLFFVRKDTLIVDYLGVDSLGGAASQLSLAGIFRDGGSVFFTATWSSESGSSSLSDYLVVVSTQGEFAVFQGSFPGGADWSLAGVYDLSPPLGINGWFKAGGDIVVLTERGAIPVSAARFKDPSALAMDAISRDIHPDWVYEVQRRRTVPWEAVKWNEKTALFINVPVVSALTPPRPFVANLQTGKWCEYTAWDTRCMVVHNGQLYFGCNDGTIRAAEISGYDLDMPYTYQIAMAWDHLGSPGFTKTVRQAKAEFLTTRPFNVLISASTDYTQEFPIPPNSYLDADPASLWDIGRFDIAVWDSGEVPVRQTTRWTSVGRTGEVFSMEIQIPIGSVNTPDIEMTVLHWTNEQGGLVV